MTFPTSPNTADTVKFVGHRAAARTEGDTHPGEARMPSELDILIAEPECGAVVSGSWASPVPFPGLLFPLLQFAGDRANIDKRVRADETIGRDLILCRCSAKPKTQDRKNSPSDPKHQVPVLGTGASHQRYVCVKRSLSQGFLGRDDGRTRRAKRLRWC